MSEENELVREIRDEMRELKSAVVTLSEAVRSQESRLSRLEGSAVPSPMPREQTVAAQTFSEGAVPPPPPRYEEVTAPDTMTGNVNLISGATFSAWFKVDWPMKVGALLILLGFGWFVSYAFANNWIGPVGRIALGILAGVALLAGGHFRARATLNQGGVLLGLGTATTLLTIFAAREIYDFFTPTLAIVFMSLVVVFTTYSSLVYKSRAIAFMSLIAGGIAPLLTAGESNFLGLFSYLFLLSAGTLWVVRMTAWRPLVFTSLTIVSLYSIPFIAGLGGVERFEALLVAFSFAALYFVTGLFGILKDRVAEKWDLSVVALNGFLTLGWIHSFVSGELQSFAAVGVAVVFLVGAYFVFRVTHIAVPVYLYAGNAFVFFVAATAYELSGATFVIALALEIGLLIAGTLALLRDPALVRRLGWLMALPVLFSMESVDNYSRVLRPDSIAPTSMGTSWYESGVLTSDFFVLLVMAIVAGALAFLYRFTEAETNHEARVATSHIFTALSTLYVLFLIWFMLKRALEDADTAAMLALTLYTIAGIVIYMRGRILEKQETQMFGGIILVLVAVRLLLVEVWQMDIFGRIITFFVIGALFMSTAFLGRKKKDAFPPIAGGTIAGIALLCSFSPLSSVSAENIVSDDSPLAAFEYVESVALPALQTPSVVEVPVNNPMFRDENFAVYEETTGVFQPSAYRSVNQRIAVQASANSGEGSAQNLVDRNSQTTVSFPARDDGTEAVAEIRIRTAKPLVLSGIVLELDRFVSLPRSAEVVRLDGEQQKVVLAKTNVSDHTIRFPRETGTEWLIRFSYIQPLRITELLFFDENTPIAEREAIRFLARPGESYRIYFGADRPVSMKIGESSNLLDNQDIVRVSAGAAQRNPAYVPADTDGDGIRDTLDNCVSISNPDQADETNNGRGDVCDDYDKDGIANSKDNCPSHPNRVQTDTDADGKGDVCDSEESRITEKYLWLPWAAMVVAGFVVAGLFAATIRRERNKK